MHSHQYQNTDTGSMHTVLCHFFFLCTVGIVSLVSLAILSYERYTTVLCPAKADVSDFRKAWLSIGGSWLYALVWTVPPLLGWSSYGPEGPGTTCSVQWQQPSANSISYVVCLFLFCLFLPLLLMIFCYSKILLVIRGVSDYPGSKVSAEPAAPADVTSTK